MSYKELSPDQQPNRSRKTRRILGAAAAAVAGIATTTFTLPLNSSNQAEQKALYSPPRTANTDKNTEPSQGSLSPQQIKLILQIGNRYGGYYSLVINILNSANSPANALSMVNYDQTQLSLGVLNSRNLYEQGLIDAQSTNNFSNFLSQEHSVLSLKLEDK